MRLVPLAVGLFLLALAGFLALAAGTRVSTVVAQDETTVTMGDFFFCDPSFDIGACETTVSVGDTIVWEYTSGSVGHTVTHCGDSCDSPTDSPLWDSTRELMRLLAPGESFSFAFDTPGTYLYFCTIHPLAMRARVVVEARATETPGPTVTATATAIPTPQPAVTSNLGDDDGVSPWWFVLAGIGGALVVIGGGALVMRRYRG